MRRGRAWGVLAVVAVFAAVVSAARAARPERGAPPTGDFWSFPDGTVAFCAVDPQAFSTKAEIDPGQVLIAAGIRGLVNHALDLEETGPVDLDVMLAPGTLGPVPYRLCLLALEAGQVPGREANRPFRIGTLSAVLDIRSTEADALTGALRASLSRPGARGSSSETAITLANGRRAMRFSREGEPPWRDVEWCATDSAFLVGFGRGTLDRWMANPVSKDPRPDWTLQSLFAVRNRPPSTPVFQAYINLNALREGVSDSFFGGRFADLADAWHIANARSVMVHAGIPKPPTGQAAPQSPVLISVDLTYTSRAEKPGSVHTVALSQSAWPIEAEGLPRPVTPYALLLRADWQNWAIMALETYAALSSRQAAQQPERWLRRHKGTLERLAAQAGPYVVLAGGPAPAGQRPIAAATRLISADKDSKWRLEGDLREIFGSLGDEVRREQSGLYTLRIPPREMDPDGVIRTFNWMASPDATLMAAAFTPQPVEALFRRTGK